MSAAEPETYSDERANAVNHGVRPLALLAAAASTAAVVATAFWVEQWNVVAIALLVAAAWGAIVSAVDAYANWRPRPPESLGLERGSAVTFVMRLSEERLDIARTSVVLAAAAGPVVVAATRHHDFLDSLGDVGFIEIVAPTMTEALHDAVRSVTTESVLVLSASAFPLRDACVTAARRLTDGVGWVTGAAPAFNNDRYAPGERELMGARVRAAARELGAVTWEPDATIVRTSVLREHPQIEGRPDGAWLRDRVADGWRGASCSEPVAIRAAPADAPVFWPTQTKRRRGAVADLADSVTRGPARARVVAFGGLLRELYAYSTLLWLLAIVMIGRSGVFPFAVSAAVLFTLHAALGVTRWVSSRLSYGVGLHPVDEAREAAYDVPGSLLALPSALTRRVRPVRITIPDQPLLWMALVVTLLTTIPLLDRKTSTGGTVGVAVGLALTALGASWVFALRAFGARDWDRASYRIAVDVPATINGQSVQTVDASPSGVAVAGPSISLTRGATVAVTVAFDASPASVNGRVTDVRRAGDRTEVGVALDLAPNERTAWVRALFAATVADGRTPLAPFVASGRAHRVFVSAPAPFRRRVLKGFQIAAVGGASVLVFSALLLALIGYRPMVERSGSMVPSLRIGDVVVANWVRVDQVRPGEVITFPADFARPELVTHRVQSVVVNGNTVHVITKGDANIDTEAWDAPRNELVGHVDWTLPKLGRVLVVLGENSTRWFLLAITAAAVSVAIAARALRRRVRGNRLAIS